MENGKITELSEIYEKTSEHTSSNLVITDLSASVTEDNKVLVFLKGKGKSESVIFLATLIGMEESDNEVKLSYVDTVDSCDPHLFPWNDKIIVISTDCRSDVGDGVTLKEFTEIKKWVNGCGSFSRLLQLPKNKKDFTPATTGNSSLLLFTQLRNNDGTSGGGDQYGSYLFISDGTSVKKIGVLAEDVKSVAPVRLLFTNGELFTLHKKTNGNENKNIILTRQQGLLATIVLVVDAWKNADKAIQAQCRGTSKKHTMYQRITQRCCCWLSVR